MRSAYPPFVAIAEHWQLFYAGYLGGAVASGFLRGLIVLYQDREVYLRLESERDIVSVGCEAVRGRSK